VHLVVLDALKLASKRFYFITEGFRYLEVGATLPFQVILALLFAEVLPEINRATLNLFNLVRVEPFNALAFFPEARLLSLVRD